MPSRKPATVSRRSTVSIAGGEVEVGEYEFRILVGVRIWHRTLTRVSSGALSVGKKLFQS